MSFDFVHSIIFSISKNMQVFSIVYLSKWLLGLWLACYWSFYSLMSSFYNFFTCYFSLLRWRLDLLSDRFATKLDLFLWSSLLSLLLFLPSLIRLYLTFSELLSIFLIRLTRLLEMLLLLLWLELLLFLFVFVLLSVFLFSTFFGSSLRLIWYLGFLTIAVDLLMSFSNYFLLYSFFLYSIPFLLLLAFGDKLFLASFCWGLFGGFLFWDELLWDWETKLADLISIFLKTFEWLARELAPLLFFDALFLGSSLIILLFWAFALCYWFVEYLDEDPLKGDEVNW